MPGAPWKIIAEHTTVNGNGIPRSRSVANKEPVTPSAVRIHEFTERWLMGSQTETGYRSRIQEHIESIGQ
jgi:hypothetical protein